MKTLFFSFSLVFLSYLIFSLPAYGQVSERGPLPCHADFNYNIMPYGDSVIVQFTNRSVSYKTVFWKFDAHDSSVTVSPTFTYSANPDSVLVCLTVIDSLATCRDIYCDTISLVSAGINLISGSDFSISLYPNPVGDKTNIVYSLKEPAEVTIDVFDMLGQKVVQLFNGGQFAGKQQIAWASSNVANGIYLLRVTLDGQIFTRRISVMH